MYLVYKHITPNGKIYVGQTNNLKKRWGANGKNYSRCPHFYNAIKKYGWSNIQHIIVSEGLTKKEADYLEKYLIRYYNSDDPKYGYNLTAGGEGGTQNEETRKKMSAAKKGKPSNRKGVKASEETKERLRKSGTLFQKGHKLSDEARKKLSEALKGKSHPEALAASNEVTRKAVVCVETNSYFKSLADAAKSVNRSSSALVIALKTGSKSAGYHWKYVS